MIGRVMGTDPAWRLRALALLGLVLAVVAACQPGSGGTGY